MQRQTRQNQAVLNAIADSGRCLHAAEIWTLAKREVPSLNLSTVYRQLKTLHERRQISRVELPGEPPRFEAACGGQQALTVGLRAGRAGRAPRAAAPGGRGSTAAGHGHHAHDAHDAQAGEDHHHHHFHCTACERVFVLHACPGPLDALLPAGFTLQRHDLTLHGHCGDCAAATPGAAGVSATAAVADAGPAAALVLMFALGARHGIEPDHIAAIDGITLRAHDRRQRGAAWTGSWFAAGHGAGVTLLALAIHLFSSGVVVSPGVADALEWVPLALLFAVGALNLRALLGAQAYQPTSVRGWLLPRALRERGDAWAALLTGLLFSLVVDVVTQLSAWSVGTTQQRGATGVLLAGLLFSAGLALTATIDSALLCHLLRRQQGAQSLLRLRRGMGWFVVVLSFGVAAYGSVDKLGGLTAVDRIAWGWLWLAAAGLASAAAAGVVWRRGGTRSRPNPAAPALAHPPANKSVAG